MNKWFLVGAVTLMGIITEASADLVPAVEEAKNEAFEEKISITYDVIFSETQPAVESVEAPASP